MNADRGISKKRLSVPLTAKSRSRLGVLAALNDQSAAALAQELLEQAITREHNLEFDALLHRVK